MTHEVSGLDIELDFALKETHLKTNYDFDITFQKRQEPGRKTLYNSQVLFIKRTQKVK
jgi:hypothetical protein